MVTQRSAPQEVLSTVQPAGAGAPSDQLTSVRSAPVRFARVRVALASFAP
jgi:hypothetical protein